jgi:hypothetical protein
MWWTVAADFWCGVTLAWLSTIAPESKPEPVPVELPKSKAMLIKISDRLIGIRGRRGTPHRYSA